MSSATQTEQRKQSIGTQTPALNAQLRRVPYEQMPTRKDTKRGGLRSKQLAENKQHALKAGLEVRKYGLASLDLQLPHRVLAGTPCPNFPRLALAGSSRLTTIPSFTQKSWQEGINWGQDSQCREAYAHVP